MDQPKRKITIVILAAQTVLLAMLAILLPQITVAGQLRTLEVNVTFDPSSVPDKSVVGYRLYEDLTLVCETTDIAGDSFTCSFITENGEHSYTISAVYQDGTESDKSTPFLLTINDLGTLRTLEISISYDTTQITDKTLAGYRLYEDSALVCETDTPSTATISCSFNTTDGPHSYQLSAYFTDNSESPKSEPIEFIIGDTSQLDALEFAIPADLVIDKTKTVAGYRLYVDSLLICESANPSATSMSCLYDGLDGVHNYTVTALYTDGTESSPSAPVEFVLGDTLQLRTLEVALTFDLGSLTDKTLAGYRLYEDSLLACETYTTTTTTFTCEFMTTDGTHSYELAAFFTDDTESQKSTPFLFTISDSTTPGDQETQLAANISATPTTGSSPLAVNFSAVNSTGNIATYHWDFGDGDTSSEISPSHTYAIPGSFTATLIITDSLDNIATTSVVILAEETVVTDPVPPTALISSSGAAGESPFSVTFDGTGSSANGSATLVSYDWEFGDGATGSGSTATHIYTIPGTFNAKLTVVDNLGLSNSTTTPVIVTQSTTVNQTPVASFSATPTSGTAPLSVLFDASMSQDSDGNITSYSWNFGDGTSGSGINVQHVYPTAATYTVSLKVTDDKGAVSPAATKAIEVGEQQQPILYYEIGELGITSDWARVTFENPFSKPAVFISPPTYNDHDPVLVRIRNLNSTGFDIRLQEWDYLDDKHLEEVVSFIVLEQGQTQFPDGTMIEVGSFNGSTRKQNISFRTVFKSTPVVLTTVTSVNEADAVTGRITGVSNTGFSYFIQEQESTKNKHTDESVVYLAWSPGTGSIDSLIYGVVQPSTLLTDQPTSITFSKANATAPFLFVELQTLNDADSASLRLTNLTQEGFVVFIQEEQSKNSETSHSPEAMGYLYIAPAPAAP